MKFAAFFITFLVVLISDINSQAIELGRVHWLRDYDQAMIKAKKENKPVLLLFQEVPGCLTCRNYGYKVLSHPLIVEAIESYFIPLCIYNNKSGKDKTILDRFNEPGWNNPVVRILDSNANDLVKRINNAFEPYHLISQINASLIKAGKKLPVYLQLLEEELLSDMRGTNVALLGVHCFWSGELAFSRFPGVVATKALYIGSREAVEIKFDPWITSLEQIIRFGKQKQLVELLYLKSGEKTDLDIKTVPLVSSKVRIDPESKYYLFKSKYKSVPMTEFQALKANSFIAEGESCLSVLSPRQIEYSKTLLNKPYKVLKNKIGQDIYEAWYSEMPQSDKK